VLFPGVRFEASKRPFVERGHRPRVLFLCTGNSARSQMAEALLHHRTNGRVEARSAGSRPKPLHPNAVRAMAEHGIDISTCKSKSLRRYARTRFDHVVTLCDKVREICPEFAGQPETAHWSIADPALAADTDAASYPSFVRTAIEIQDRVSVFVAQLTN
jgi:protein-tyrosine-phosphatase